MGWWSSAECDWRYPGLLGNCSSLGCNWPYVTEFFFRFSKVFQMVFVKRKSGNKSLKTHRFHLGMKHMGMLRSGRGKQSPRLFQGCNVWGRKEQWKNRRGRNIHGRNVGNVTYLYNFCTYFNGFEISRTCSSFKAIVIFSKKDCIGSVNAFWKLWSKIHPR
jgi:hypothetical protein